jgi:hypothetical protein
VRVKIVLGVWLQKALKPPPRTMKLESLAWDFIRAGRYGLSEAFIQDNLSKTRKRASDLRQMVRHDAELLSRACKGPQRSTS